MKNNSTLQQEVSNAFRRCVWLGQALSDMPWIDWNVSNAFRRCVWLGPDAWVEAAAVDLTVSNAFRRCVWLGLFHRLQGSTVRLRVSPMPFGGVSG